MRSRRRDWYELTFGDDSDDDSQHQQWPSLNANDESSNRDSHELTHCDMPQENSKHRRSLNTNMLEAFDLKAQSQDASCWEQLKIGSELSSCCSTSSGSDISRSSSISDVSDRNSRVKTTQQHGKCESRYPRPTLWYNFVELADRVTDIEVNDHPCIWLNSLLKQRFPITRDGRNVLEIPPKLLGCQGNHLRNDMEKRSYTSVSVAVNPVLNAGRLAILFASKALAGQASSVPTVAGESDKKLGVALDFLKKIPKAKAKVCDLFGLSDLSATDVSLSKQFWSGLCEKFKESNNSPEPCCSLIAVPEELINIWARAQSSPTEACHRRFVMNVAKWVLRITQLFENDPHLESNIVLFPKSMVPVISGKRAARASMLDYFVKHDAVRRVPEWKI